MRCLACSDELVRIKIRTCTSGTNLGDDFGIRVQLQKTPCELGRRGVIIRLCEDVDGTSESDLHVRRLQCTMREVCGEFETPLNVIGVFLCNASSFKLYRNTEKIFTRSGDSVSPLFDDDVSVKVKRSREER